MRVDSISAGMNSYKTQPEFKAIKVTDKAMLERIPKADVKKLKNLDTGDASRLIMQRLTEAAEWEAKDIIGNYYIKKMPILSTIIKNSITNRANEILQDSPKGIDFVPIIGSHYEEKDEWDNFEDARRHGFYVEPVLRTFQDYGSYDVIYCSSDFPIPFTIRKYDPSYSMFVAQDAEYVPDNDVFEEIPERFSDLTDPDDVDEVVITLDSGGDLNRELIDKNTEFQDLLRKVKTNTLEEKDITGITEVPPISNLSTDKFHVRF